jgi:hypothetical protein
MIILIRESLFNMWIQLFRFLMQELHSTNLDYDSIKYLKGIKSQGFGNCLKQCQATVIWPCEANLALLILANGVLKNLIG